jgi:hypothetical protein
MGQMRNAYKMFIEKPEGKRPRERPMCRWNIILKMILGKYGGRLAEDRDQ